MPPARSVTWAPRAKRDLRDIWRYLARTASPEIADRVLREIAAATARLERNPVPGRQRNELRPGLRSLLVHPHMIFFRVQDGQAQVSRVLREQRDFPSSLREGD